MSLKLPSAASSLCEAASHSCLGSNLARASAIALVAFSAACAAQTPPSPGNMPPASPVAAGPAGAVADMTPPGPPPAPTPFLAQQQPPVATGTISRFIINPEGDVDGFILTDGVLVHFPPHMSSQLVSLVHRGDTVRIVGLRDGAGNVRAQQIANEQTGQQLVDQPPPTDVSRLPPALRGAGLVKLNVKGVVMRVTTAPRGEPDGVILKDGTVIKMAPPVAQQFTSILRQDVVIAARGYGTRNEYGEALQATAFGTPDNVVQLYNSVPN